jgi:hypothetical protein
LSIACSVSVSSIESVIVAMLFLLYDRDVSPFTMLLKTR